MDDADTDNKYDQVFTFAQGEGQHPLSLYQDKDAEYLCFPSIFCARRPTSKDERSVPIHYSDIVKWELRSFQGASIIGYKRLWASWKDQRLFLQS